MLRRLLLVPILRAIIRWTGEFFFKVELFNLLNKFTV